MTTPNLSAASSPGKPLWLEPLKTHGSLLTMALIYGGLFAFLRHLVLHVSPLEVSVIRVMGTGVFMGLLTVAAPLVGLKLTLKKPESLKEGLYIALLGFLGIAWMQLTASVAVHLTTSFQATLIMATIPVQSSLLSVAMGKERFGLLQSLGLLLGLAGVAGLISAQNNLQGVPSTWWLGDLIVLSNALLFSVYLVLSKPVLQRYTPFALLAWTTWVAALFCVPLLFLGEFLPHALNPLGLPGFVQIGHALGQLHGPALWEMAYLIVLAGWLGYWLTNYALARTTSSTVAAYIFIEPVWTAYIAACLTGEPFTWAMTGWGLLTIVGLVLAIQTKAPCPTAA